MVGSFGPVLVIDLPQRAGGCALVLCICGFGNAGHSVVEPPLIVFAPMGPGLFSTWAVCLLGVLGVSHAWGALWFGAASVSSTHLVCNVVVLPHYPGHVPAQ